MSRDVTWGQEDGEPNLSLTTIDGILKEDYVQNEIANTVNMSTYLMTRMKSEKVTGGRRFVFPVRFGIGEGQGNRREREGLPNQGFGEYDQAMGNVLLQYGTIDISGPAIAATQGNKAAFVSALTQALEDCRDGFKLEAYRQQWGTGDGTMGKVRVGASSITQQVTDPYGLAYHSSALENSQKVRPYRVGQTVFFKISNAVRTIVGVNGDGSIELNTTISTTTGERIIRGDSTTLNNEDKEYHGVAGTVSDTGTYLSIPRAGKPGWQSNLIDMAGEALSEDVLQLAFDTASIHGDGITKPDLLISEHVVRRLYVKLLTVLKRFPNTLKLEGGFDEDALDFNGRPYVVDKLCPPQRLYYLSTKDWQWMVMKQVGWLQEDGHVLKWIPGYDKYQGILAAYRDIVCKKPANQTVIFDITHSGESEA